MKDYAGKVCPHCNYIINENDDVAFCSACTTPHHKHCWDRSQSCGIEGCNSTTIEGNIIYCPYCGGENGKEFNYCKKCGKALSSSTYTSGTSYAKNQDYNNYSPSYSSNNYGSRYTDEGLEGGEKALLCLGNLCISPLLGIILYFVWKDDKPKKSEDACTVTILGAVAWIVLVIIFGLGR